MIPPVRAITSDESMMRNVIKRGMLSRNLTERIDETDRHL